jgi:hypothetical protein
VDTAPGVLDTPEVLGPGVRSQRLAKTLNAAYAEGLLGERTLTHRLDALFAGELIDPAGLVGDLLALDWTGARDELLIGRLYWKISVVQSPPGRWISCGRAPSACSWKSTKKSGSSA